MYPPHSTTRVAAIFLGALLVLGSVTQSASAQSELAPQVFATASGTSGVKGGV